MEFNHRVSGIDQVGSVDLDFVIVLSICEGRSQTEGQKWAPEKALSREEG